MPTSTANTALFYAVWRRVLLGLLVLLVFTQCRRRREPALFLLPPGFVGNVVVVYDQSRGQPREYRDGRRVYRIPPAGVLFTQFGPNTGLGPADEYRYADARGRPGHAVLYNWQTLAADRSSDTVGCCQVLVTDSNTPRTHYIALVVGPNRQLDSLLERQNTLIFSLAKTLQKRGFATP